MQTSHVIQSMTAMELSIAERTSKLSIATLEDPNFPKVDLLGALAWVVAKRAEPTLTFKAFMEGNTLEGITEALGITDDEDDDDEPGEDPAE